MLRPGLKGVNVKARFEQDNERRIDGRHCYDSEHDQRLRHCRALPPTSDEACNLHQRLTGWLGKFHKIPADGFSFVWI